MEKVITEDGSVTFRNMEVDECYHTKSGAVEEAFEKHARPSGVIELAKKKETIVIFDVCFGLGYNTAAAIDLIKKANPECRVEIYAFDNDQLILDKILEADASFESFELLKKIVKTHFVDEGKVSIKVLLGDAKLKIKEVDIKADIVFFDPFSPKKSPHMWEKEFLKDIYDNMNINGVLTTYSCARFVRDNLRSAGFKVIDGPVIGRRSPSTIAIK